MKKEQSHKKTIAAFIFAAFILLASCSRIPSGYISKEEHFQKDGVQDYTDYAEYVYSSSSVFEENGGYFPVPKSEFDALKGYTGHFKSCLTALGRADEYGFDDSCFSETDYYRLEIKYKDNIYANYTLWYFDTETLTLYYFHNNS